MKPFQERSETVGNAPTATSSTTATATVGTSSSSKMSAQPRSRGLKRWGQEKRSVIAEVADYCRAHSIPPPDRACYAIVSQQIGNLLNGGYALRDVREVALDLAAEFTLATYHTHLSRLQQTVHQRYEDARIAEHGAIVGPVGDVEARRRTPAAAPDVAAAMGRPLRDVPSRYGTDPRPKLAPQRQPDSPGPRCPSCRHWSIEHGPKGCATCARVGRACAA